MLKKIYFLFLISIIFMLLPLAKVDATLIPTYVGVQVTATEPATSAGVAEPGIIWCLPKSTTMEIISASVIGGGTNPITTTKPICPGSTIWSALLNLTVGTSYTIKISTGAEPFCSGYWDLTTCYETWDTEGQGKNCNDVCARYGQTPKYYGGGPLCYNSTSKTGPQYCEMMGYLKGTACSTCESGNYTYYSKITNDCRYNSDVGSDCGLVGAPAENLVRVCACIPRNTTNTELIFNFPSAFTP